MNVTKELITCNKKHVVFFDRENYCYCYHCVAHNKVDQSTIYDMVYSERPTLCNGCGDTIPGTEDADYYNNH